MSGLTIIAFVGSVFSPYYAWSGRADPLDHCAVNVALYGPGGGRWAMTERRAAAVRRESASLWVGPSGLTWEGGALTVRFDEITAPIPSRLRGEVRLSPRAVNREGFVLDAAGRHVWRPIAPRADVEVALRDPAGGWRGEGYLDTNAGGEPLEAAFRAWDWSRAHVATDTLLFYDVERRDGGQAGLALRARPDGTLAAIEPPPRAPLPLTFWRLKGHVRAEAAHPPRVRRILEDTPFYSRTALIGRHDGETAEIVHESLSLDRLRAPIVRAMLPFRMPRIFW
jgi:carotenoid 1,2-hydratase